MQITLTQVNGQSINLDTYAIKEYALDPNNSSQVQVFYYDQGAIAQIAVVSDTITDISKKSPYFFSVTDVSQSLNGLGITATIPISTVTAGIVAGNNVTINGMNAGVVISNTGSSLVVGQLNAPIPSGAKIKGYTTGNVTTGVASVNGTPTYTYAYSTTRYLNAEFRNFQTSPAGIGAVNCIYYFDEDSSIIDQIFVSDTMATIKSAIDGTGAVTQATSITTGVTKDTQKVVITTVNTNLAANASAVFTLSNKFITATSQLLVSVIGYAGTPSTNGLPYVYAKNRTTGAVDIVLANVHGTNALNNTPVTIQVEILNPLT